MSTSPYPLATVACTASSAGLSAPLFSDILASFQASVQGIYGSDTYLEPDSKDGNLLAILAQAQSDSNQATLFAVNQYNAQTAVGIYIDGAIEVNGLVRLASSFSTVVLTIIGVAGTSLENQIAADENGNLWDLPPSVVIPPSGTVNVTAVAQNLGAIVAAAGTVTTMYTITLGWQSVTNALASAPGLPVEQDGALRQRQLISTTLIGETMVDSIEANVAQVPGVSRSLVYENKTSATDINGVPSHSICTIVLGGDINAVASVIQQKKAPGAGTYGSSSAVVLDQKGLPVTISFQPLILVPVYAAITIKLLPGYTSAVGQQIVAALAAFVSGLSIGEDVYQSWAIGVAGLSGPAQQTFVIASLYLGISAGPSANGDITIGFDQAAQMDATLISLSVTT